MEKKKTVFFCSECGNESSKWFGRCTACGAWNTAVEEELQPEVKTKHVASYRLVQDEDNKPKALTEIEVGAIARITSGYGEIDRVLGGGIVPGALILLGGDPGIGKSTLLLQVSGRIAEESGKVLYASGEESDMQLKLRAHRLGINSSNLLVQAETNLDTILNEAKRSQPMLLVIDSIQTMYVGSVESAPGSVSQVRECTARLLRFAKDQDIPVIIIGHVTKDGTIAGPRMLEHMVDVVLYFEGERSYQFRILRGIKNRFGSTSES